MTADTSTPSPVPSSGRSAAMIFVFVTVLLDSIALGVVIPVLPPLVVSLLHGDMKRTAYVIGVFGTCWAFMQFVWSPLLGALSDRYGRRPVILLSNFGLGLDYILMALAPTISWLFVGRIVSGITAASFPTAGAYIADVTPPEKRAGSYGTLGAAFGLGFIVGPALGGLFGQMNPRLPFWVAAGLSLANACYGIFVLPESLTPERRAPFLWRKANPVAALGLLRSHRELLGLTAVLVCFYLAHEIFPNLYVLYAQYRFHWSTGTMGLGMTLTGIGMAVVQAVLTRATVARLGERATLLLGTAFGVLGFALYGLAWQPWMFWLAIPITSLWGLGGPASQAIMSRRVSASEQGRLQGATSSLRGITGMLGPVLYTGTFAACIGGGWLNVRGWTVVGTPFLVSSALVLIALIVAARVTTRRDDETVLELEPSPPPAYTSDVP